MFFLEKQIEVTDAHNIVNRPYYTHKDVGKLVSPPYFHVIISFLEKQIEVTDAHNIANRPYYIKMQ